MTDTLATARSALARWGDWVCLLVISGGAGVRIYQWLLNRSLWLDEAYLAANFVDRGIVELAAPLDFNQSAPYLFLVGTELVTRLLGEGEMALRLLPLIASIAGLWLFWRVARALLPAWCAPLAVAAMAFGNRNIYYSQELKQYSLEMLVVIAALLLLVSLERERSSKCFVWIGLFGMLAIFASHTAPFALAGVGLAATWVLFRKKVDVSWALLVMVGAVWAVLFVLNYAKFIAPNYENELMNRFWAFAFPGWPLSADALGAWFSLTDEFLGYLGYFGVFKILFGLLVLIGCIRAVTGGRLAALGAFIGLMTYALAVAAGKAPLFGRVSLFLVPWIHLLAFLGLAELLRKRAWYLLLLSAFIAAWPGVRTLPRNIRPIQSQQFRETLLWFRQERKDPEPVFVTFWMAPAVRYYLREDPATVATFEIGSEARIWRPVINRKGPPVRDADIEVAVQEMAHVAGQNRFWILEGNMDRTREAFVAEISERYGCRVERSVRMRGAAAYLFVRN